MKIIKLSSKNVKNLKAIEIAPDGNIVTLSGMNGAGKSTILDSIFSALTGKRLKDPIRHGEKRADVLVDMGEFTVKKRWTEKGEAIEVFTKDAEGDKVKKTSPQKFLDSVIGELSFDPLAFQNMDSKAQVELLKGIAGLDFADLDKEYEKIYDDRSALNSQIRESAAHLKIAEAPAEDTPDEEIKFKDALEKLNKLRVQQDLFQEGMAKRNTIQEDGKRATGRITEIDNEIEELQKEREQLLINVADLRTRFTDVKLPPVVSQDDIQLAEIELEGIESKNADIRAAKRYREAVRNSDKLKKAADVLTEKIKRIAQDKQGRAAKSKMPIDGLALADEGVTYKGMLFEGLSTGQQIRVSTAIGMALNPKLKVVFIREGSLLDSIGLKEIAAMAQDKDYQIWIEKCDETGKVGLYIEAGEIVKKEGKAVPKPKPDTKEESKAKPGF